MKYTFIACLCLYGLVLNGQTIQVVDVQTGQPLAGVSVSSQQRTEITDENGEFDLGLFEGDTLIVLRYLGYKTITSSYSNLQNRDGLVELESMRFAMDQVVVSATRWRQSGGSVPYKITTVRPEDVRLQNPQTAADLLGLSGKVFIQKSQQGGGSPMIRGFSTNRLVYTVDGVRMNTAIFRGGNIQNVINIDPFAVEQTEVLFGPGSVLYGSDAIGGVMSFQTLNPIFATNSEMHVSGNLAARYSSANQEQSGHFDLRLGGKKWAAVTSFSSWDFDHLRQGRFGPDDYLKSSFVDRENDRDVVVEQEEELLQKPSAYTQFNVMQKLAYRSGTGWDLEYGFHFSRTSNYGRYDRHNRDRDGQPRYGEWRYGPQSWMMNQLKWTTNRANLLYDQAAIILAIQNFEESRLSRFFSEEVRQKRTENVEAYSINVDMQKSFDNKQELFYGFEGVRNDVASQGIQEDITTGIELDAADRYPQADWSSLGAYVQYEYKSSDRWTWLAGGRYSHFVLNADFTANEDFYPFPYTDASLSKGAVTGSLGTVYRPSDSWVIKANAGTAFRSPNVDDIGKVFDSEPGIVVVPNPDLEPEYVYNADLGMAKVWNDAIRIEATAYYSFLDQALVRRPFPLDGQDSILYDGRLSEVQALVNAADAHVFGLQLGLEWKWNSFWSLATDANFQEGEERMKDGSYDPSRHVAPFFGVTRLRYKRPNWMLEVNANYQGRFDHEDLSPEERGKSEIYALDRNGLTYAPSWYTLNLKGQFNFQNGLTLNAGIENITDQRYRPYSSGISGAGRNVVISVNWSF